MLEKALQMEEVMAVTFREQTLVELNPDLKRWDSVEAADMVATIIVIRGIDGVVVGGGSDEDLVTIRLHSPASLTSHCQPTAQPILILSYLSSYQSHQSYQS